MIRAARRAYGPGIATEISADAYHESDDYYYFGFRTLEAAQFANDRLDLRRQEIRAAGGKKPHCLMVAGLPLGGNTRWLTLAVGDFDCDGKEMVMQPNTSLNKLMLFYGFDSQQEVLEAAARVRQCPHYQPSRTKLALFHLSRHDGGLDIQPLHEEDN